MHLVGALHAKVEPKLAALMRKAKDQAWSSTLAYRSRHQRRTGHTHRDRLPEVITLQYNMLDRKLEEASLWRTSAALASCAWAGGRRQVGRHQRRAGAARTGMTRVPELALRLCSPIPTCPVALSGMSIMRTWKKTWPSPLTGARSAREAGAINEHLARMKALADLYCTGCKY
jgi:hypothetical protein